MAQFIKTSDLRHRAKFITKDRKKDRYGQVVETDIEVATVYACIREQMLRDKASTVGTILENTTSIIIRYRQDFKIDTTMKVNVNNAMYEIIDISKGIYKQDFTVLTCKEL